METLTVRLQDVDDLGATYELDWAVDHDDVLLAFSDRLRSPAEPILGASADDSAEVCATLFAALEGNGIGEGDPRWLVLAPLASKWRERSGPKYGAVRRDLRVGRKACGAVGPATGQGWGSITRARPLQSPQEGVPCP